MPSAEHRKRAQLTTWWTVLVETVLFSENWCASIISQSQAVRLKRPQALSSSKETLSKSSSLTQSCFGTVDGVEIAEIEQCVEKFPLEIAYIIAALLSEFLRKTPCKYRCWFQNSRGIFSLLQRCSRNLEHLFWQQQFRWNGWKTSQS